MWTVEAGGPALASGSIWVHTQPRHFPVQDALGYTAALSSWATEVEPSCKHG